MDFLFLNTQFRILICTGCKYVIVPSTLATHLRPFHEQETTRAQTSAWVNLWKDKPSRPAKDVQLIQLPAIMAKVLSSQQTCGL
jgi:hypothetical protein